MHFDYTDEHDMLRDAARGHIQRNSPVAAYRRGLTSTAAYRTGSLRLDAQQGWAAMMAGDDAVSIVEAMVVAEELGRASHSGAFAASNSAAWAVAQSPAPGLRAKVAALKAGGTALGAAAGASKVQAIVTPGGLRIEGGLRFVQDADIAGDLLVAASTEGGQLQVLVPADARGITLRPVTSVDVTRTWFDVRFEDVIVAPELIVSEGPDAISRRADLAAVLVAADSVGAAAHLLGITVAYAKERAAFGKTIAAFQAVKHRCADMLIRLESARVAVWYAALALRDQRPDAAEAAAIAKFYATEAASWIAGEALQLHGGIGMTWEHDLHLFLKRAKANELLFGSNHRHRDKVAEALAI